MREGRLESPGEHLSQDFVDAPEERYRSPIIESSVISWLRYKGDYSFIYEGRGGALTEHCRECLQEVRRDLLLTFMEKFHRNAVVSRRFALRQGANGSSHLL